MDFRRYLMTVPERTVRATAAVVGGTAVELFDVVLPHLVRRSRLYQATVDRLLRILVELVGDVRGRYPAEAMPVGTLAVKKAAGNVIEVAAFVAVGWSPLWLLAGASDLVGGSKAYLRALEGELRAGGLLPEQASADSFEELLSRLETSTGVLADAIDVPPTSLAEARTAFETLRAQGSDLPSADELGAIFVALQRDAQQEGRTLGEMSAAVGLAAARAGLELGNTHVFAFYRDALHAIAKEGLLTYLARVSRPYLSRAVVHFRPRQLTYTDRLLDRLDRRAEQP